MKPEVLEKIQQRRETLRKTLEEKLAEVTYITLEIGCGHGHFLTSYGQKFAQEICIGIDVNKGRIFKARKKVDRAGLKNVLFLECDSMEFLELLPHHIRIAKTWVLYPDPWPKKRHFKNRIIQKRFLEKLAASSTSKGLLYLRSDFEPYLEGLLA